MAGHSDEATARMRFVYAHAKLTVWIRQCSDGTWEALDWYGQVMAEGKLRVDVESRVKEMSHDFSKNIYAIATITEPKRRRPYRAKPIRRAL